MPLTKVAPILAMPNPKSEPIADSQPAALSLEQGDCFESENAQWIRENLPEYERVWQAFIGHDGCGRALPIAGLEEKKERCRKFFNQAHYSMAKSAWRLWNLVELLEDDLGSVGTVQELYRQEERLFLFAAYVGHIRDMWEDMSNTLDKNWHSDFQEFYSERSHVLHGATLPTRIKSGLVYIPKICRDKSEEGASSWHTKAIWDDIKDDDFHPILDYVTETRCLLFEKINSHHPKVFPALDAYYNSCRVSRPEPWSIVDLELRGPVLSTQTYCIGSSSSSDFPLIDSRNIEIVNSGDTDSGNL